MNDSGVILYLDEDVHVLVAKLVAARSVVAVTAQQVGRAGYCDEDQLAYSAERGMAIVTHNRVHYQTLAVRWYEEKRTHSGIIIATQGPVYELSRKLVALLDRMTPDLLANQLRYV